MFKRLYLFLERGEGKEKERDRNINVWLLFTCSPPLQLGTWPATQACAIDWESHQQPFDSQACTQSIELSQPGQNFLNIKKFIFMVKMEPFVAFCSAKSHLSGVSEVHRTAWEGSVVHEEFPSPVKCHFT